MRTRAILTICALPFVASLASAQTPVEKGLSTGEMMGDAITQPLADINLKRKGVPPLLTAIRERPYDMADIRTCRDIAAKVTELDAVMGDDVDKIEVNTRDRKRKEGAAGVTRGIISGLIPFRALIREVSGARASDQDYREAVYAGVVRRSFLKGLGQARRCRAPARPLRPMESAQQAASELLEQDDNAK